MSTKQKEALRRLRINYEFGVYSKVEYDKLVQRVKEGDETLIDRYTT